MASSKAGVSNEFANSCPRRLAGRRSEVTRPDGSHGRRDDVGHGPNRHTAHRRARSRGRGAGQIPLLHQTPMSRALRNSQLILASGVRGMFRLIARSCNIKWVTTLIFMNLLFSDNRFYPPEVVRQAYFGPGRDIN